MKHFTGKVTNVDNNGNPIKKKSTGKNGKKSGFKKPAAVKKSSGKKPLKDITAVMTKNSVTMIVTATMMILILTMKKCMNAYVQVAEIQFV